ncbi:hypothetical protein F4803DRAFT_345121 [Xylaria telfairii]|nr:hypothetical protein F4803DRAFT_345121 [Xylaria telfairii]
MCIIHTGDLLQTYHYLPSPKPLPSANMSRSPRFSELRQLLFEGDGLTLEEARYLKFLLSDVRTDLIGELPLEIVTLIALELQLDEFARCLRVSKAWRRRFLSDSVTQAYGRFRWPAMIDGAMNRPAFLETLLKLIWVSYNYRKPTNGVLVPWDSKAQFTLDPVFHNEPSSLPNIYRLYPSQLFVPDTIRGICSLYACGKVAWCLDECVIVVDDLRSKMRKVLTPPSGAMHGFPLILRSLGSRLLIASIDRLLIIWDHVDNQAYEKSLPSRICQCHTNNNRVAIVLRGGDVVIWSPGHAATQLDTSSLNVGLPQAGIRPAYSCAFFDPSNSKTLYLASGYFFHNGSTSMIRYIVHEFSEAIHIASWSSDCLAPTMHVEDSSQSYLTESMDELSIAIAEYELDHSCIVFGWQLGGRCDICAVVFDRIKRKFISTRSGLGFYSRFYPRRLSSNAAQVATEHRRQRTLREPDSRNGNLSGGNFNGLMNYHSVD